MSALDQMQELKAQMSRSIIGQEQVDYMLAEFQSEQAIEDQISGGYKYYLLVDGERSVVQVRYKVLMSFCNATTTLLIRS